MNKGTLIWRSLWVEVLVNKVMVGCCSLNWAIREMFYVTTLRMKKWIVVFIYFGFKATNFSVSQSNVFYGFSCFCCRFPFLLRRRRNTLAWCRKVSCGKLTWTSALLVSLFFINLFTLPVFWQYYGTWYSSAFALLSTTTRHSTRWGSKTRTQNNQSDIVAWFDITHL